MVEIIILIIVIIVKMYTKRQHIRAALARTLPGPMIFGLIDYVSDINRYNFQSPSKSFWFLFCVTKSGVRDS